MIRVYFAHACRNAACVLYLLEAPGTDPGLCPRCGWLRRLASIRTVTR